MGIPGRLPRDSAQAEAHAGIEIRGTDIAVVEADRLAFAVFQEKLSVVAAAQRLIDDLRGGGLIQRGVRTLEKQLVGGGDGAHGSNPSMFVDTQMVCPSSLDHHFRHDRIGPFQSPRAARGPAQIAKNADLLNSNRILVRPARGLRSDRERGRHITVVSNTGCVSVSGRGAFDRRCTRTSTTVSRMTAPHW